MMCAASLSPAGVTVNNGYRTPRAALADDDRSRSFSAPAFPRVAIFVYHRFVATAVEAVRNGAINYLSKPADTDQILAAFDADEQVPAAAAEAAEALPSLARVEWEHIQRVLTDCDNNISLAARKLGIHRRSLQRKLGKLPPME